jgi:hypothetical protein
MRRFVIASAIFLLALNLSAQTSGPPPSQAEEHPAPLSTVAGKVVTLIEGSPLKSARVALVRQDTTREDSGSRTRVYAATSDSDGRFLLKNVAPGRYEFFATHAGFVNQQYEATGTGDGAVLALKPGQTVSDVLFRMTMAAVVTGRVTNEDGEAMSRVQVVALSRPTEEEIEDDGRFTSRKRDLRPVSSAQTDDRGQYRIFGLKPGEYHIKATDSSEPDRNVSVDQSFWVKEFLGSEYAPVYYPGVLQVGQAQLVSVRPGEELQADVSMPRVKTVEVAGQVIGQNGPAKDTWVHLEEPGGDYGIERQATTDEKGKFRLRGIPPGSYVIVAYQRSENNVYESRARQKVDVGREGIESLTVSLGGGASFQGRVTVTDLGPVTLDRIVLSLSPIDEDEESSGYGRVKKDGTFEMTSVRDGNYAISVWGLEGDWYVKSVRLGASDLLENGLQVEKGSGGRLEVVVRSDSARLEGSVRDHDSAVVGALVRVVPDPETPYNRFRWQSTRADQTGHFSVSGLAPGNYRVLARYPTSPGSISLKSDPLMVTLSEHDHKTVQLTIVHPRTE